jgi:hypothetical protein
MATPVQIHSASTPSALVHALANVSRVVCYRPFTSSDPITARQMAELNLRACPYCWPNGINWPESAT